MGNLAEYYRIIHTGTPRLRYCERFDDASRMWNYSRHSHPYIELMYFMEGGGGLEASGKRLSVNLYDLVVYPADWEHQEEPARARRREIICLWIDLPGLKLDDLLRVHDYDSSLGRLIQDLHREAKRERPEPLVLEYSMKLLLTKLLRAVANAGNERTQLSYVFQYIALHYAEPISLEQLAALEHISKSYLSRQFKRLTGQTVVSYINTQRIETAKLLLSGSTESVNEIAYQVGFESPKYFYRTFKALTGESPAAFRRRAQNRKLTESPAGPQSEA